LFYFHQAVLQTGHNNERTSAFVPSPGGLIFRFSDQAAQNILTGGYQIPCPKGRGMLFSRGGYTQGFNTFLTAPRGGVLNPPHE
jgi:hypothetical protein